MSVNYETPNYSERGNLLLIAEVVAQRSVGLLPAGLLVAGLAAELLQAAQLVALPTSSEKVNFSLTFSLSVSSLVRSQPDLLLYYFTPNC